MKKLSAFVLSSIVLFGLGACSSETTLKEEPDEVVEPKTGDVSTETTDTTTAEEETEAEAEDIWTYYENATHEEVWEGLTIKVDGVAVSDEAPGMDDSGNEIITSAVGVKFNIENTTADKMYTTYPDQATLVTSTGEQVEANMWESGDVGGDIHEGVIKDGDVFFYLERGAASEIEWIKLEWSSSYSDPDGNYENDIYHDHSVKIELK